MCYLTAIVAVFIITSVKSENIKTPTLSDLVEEIEVLNRKYSAIKENYEQMQIKYENIREAIQKIQEKSANQESQITSLQNELALISSQESAGIKPSLLPAEIENPKNNNTIEERLSHLEELAKTKVLRTCSDLKQFGVNTSGYYFIDPDGENMGHAPIRAYCDFDEGVTEVLHADDNQMITIPHCTEELCFKKEFIYTAPMDQITSLIQLSSFCSQDIIFDCYLAPLFYNDVEVGIWNDRHGEDQVYFNGANYGNHMCRCFENDTCSGHEIFHTRCNCDNSGASEWLQDSGTITNSTAVPITAFKYGPLFYETQQAKIMVGRLKCSGKADVRTPPSSCNDLKKLGETRSGLYPLQDSDNDNYAKMSYCDMSVPGYEGNIETMEGWLKFASGPGDVLFAVQHHGHQDIVVGSVVTYDKAIINNGNSMDLSSGVFTADIPALYQFTFSGLLSAISGHYSSVAIMVNGAKYIEIWGVGGWNHSNDHETVSKTIVLNLEKGNTVHLVLIAGALHGEAHYSEFMGEML